MSTNFDFLCGVDADTKLIVYRWANWPYTPVLTSADVNIQFFYFSGQTTDDIKERDFQNFAVLREKISETATLRLRTFEISAEKLSQLKFMQFRCRRIAAWLSKIHLLISGSEGILPGIYGVRPGSREEALYIEHNKKIKAIAAEIIYEFHDHMWLAKTEDEFLDVYNAAMARWTF
jgi:hypothetical protein